MEVEQFIRVLNADFYAGVPDSQLKALCNYLIDTYGVDKKHHIIAANEGNCVAIAAGYHLATGKIPVVYMQNSGEGNMTNPFVSLLHEKVYAIPEIFIIGWRGEPQVHDEPQHVYQGEITLTILETLGIAYYFVITKETSVQEIETQMKHFKPLLMQGKSVAFVVRKGALEYAKKVVYKNDYNLLREEIIKHIVQYSGKDPIISTTGKASRELFEIREACKQSHQYDFLTVGSMGHSSSIALGVALHQSDKRIWCIDGDGAVLMHLGAMAVIGASQPQHFIHIVINNSAHESVGGVPTVAGAIDMVGIARSCGYPYAVSVDTYEALDRELGIVTQKNTLSFVEVKCAIGARDDLGRPTVSTIENKNNFMHFLDC